jgi:hypothetical protein
MPPTHRIAVMSFLLMCSLHAQDQAPTPAPSTKDTVRDLHIIGVQGDEVKSILSTRIGMTFDPKTIAADLSAIEKTSAYTNALSEITRNEDGSVSITYRMDKKPTGPAD